MKKILVTLLILLVVASGCTPKETATLDKKVIKVGMELKYPPFETKDANGKPDGVSVKLAEALGEYLGKEIEIVETDYPSLIPALTQGDIDIIISSMTINEKRLEVVDFSDAYTTSQLMMLANVDSPVNSPDDLNSADVIIAAKTGTIGALWAAANAPLAQIKNVDEEAAAVLEVSQGNADVFIYDPLSIVRHHENYPDTTKAILEPLPNTQGWGIALRKNEEAFKDKINAFLKQAKEDGTFEEIRQSYLQDKIEEFKGYGLEFFF